MLASKWIQVAEGMLESVLQLTPLPQNNIVAVLLKACGGTVVKVLCYKLEGRWFDPSWCHLNFLLT